VHDVPEPTAADEELMRGGTLDLASPAGQAIGRVARELTGLRVGLALGAGSVMGFTHFGVLRTFETLGVPLDAIAGTSVGAAAGALTALGHDADAASDIFLECARTLFRPTVSSKGILSNRALHRFLRRVTPEDRIEELAVPFAAVAADLATQREIVFKRGLVHQAVLASISIPGIYPALRMGKYTVVDGAVLNPVPTNVVEDLGADVVVAVRLTSADVDADLDAEAVQVLRGGGVPSAVSTIMRAIEIMQNRVAPPPSERTTLMLVPKLTDVPTGRLRAFKEGQRFEAAGSLAVEEALPRLRVALPWLRA
jgi:NTE family protein